MSQAVIYARKSSESEDRQVLSIDSQIKELRDFAAKHGIEIGQVFTESKSAKAPGRPVFAKMMELVRRNRINVIICWKLDRLARNPVDGGALIWDVDEGKLQKIHTPQTSFSNTGNDKFWMQMEFGMAKKFVDDLSDNVKRGMKAKLQNGWLPTLAPVGYLNDPITREIVKDELRFPIIRRMWDYMLSGNHVPYKILQLATDDWGLRTRRTRNRGGNPFHPSTVYKIFHNPFYYGLIPYAGDCYPGKHAPMISKAEYDRVQELLGIMIRPKPKSHDFALTGMIRCGECGCSITASHKVNRFGSHYTYYHCTKKSRDTKCSQRVIRVEELERQISEFLESISLPQSFLFWVREAIQERQQSEQNKDKAAITALEKRQRLVKNEVDGLIDLRLRELLTDSEFVDKKRKLTEEQYTIANSLKTAKTESKEALKQCKQVFELAAKAKSTFLLGTAQDKRAIVGAIGWNPILVNKSLSIQPQKPFSFIQGAVMSLREQSPKLEPLILGERKRKTGRDSAMLSVTWALLHDVETFFANDRGNTRCGAPYL